MPDRFDVPMAAWKLVGAILTWTVCAALLVYEAHAPAKDRSTEIIALAGTGMFAACYLVSVDKIRKP